MSNGQDLFGAFFPPNAPEHGQAPNREQAIDQQIQAWNMRLKGWSHAEIALELGVSRAQVARYLNKHYLFQRAQLDETLDRNKQFDLQRIDGIIKRVYEVLEAPVIRHDDVLRACTTILECIRVRGALLGYDKKAKSEEAAADILRFITAQRVRMAQAKALELTDIEEAKRLAQNTIDLDSDAAILDSEDEE